MFVHSQIMRHRVHQVPHGLGKGRGSDIEMMKPLVRGIHGGGRNSEMNKDLGSGRGQIGMHGVKVHGPALGRPGPKMTVVRGIHTEQVAIKDLLTGGDD